MQWTVLIGVLLVVDRSFASTIELSFGNCTVLCEIEEVLFFYYYYLSTQCPCLSEHTVRNNISILDMTKKKKTYVMNKSTV